MTSYTNCFSIDVISKMLSSTLIRTVAAFVIFTSSCIQTADGGPLAYAACQAGCAGVTVACFAAAGFTFGTVPGAIIAATPALAACNSAYAACYTMCATFLVAPTPWWRMHQQQHCGMSLQNYLRLPRTQGTIKHVNNTMTLIWIYLSLMTLVES